MDFRDPIRLFRSPEDDDCLPDGGDTDLDGGSPELIDEMVESLPVEKKTVAIRLDEITPLLVEAHRSGRAWLHDFGNETVRVDSDLYDLLLVYKSLKLSDRTENPLRDAA